MSVGRNQSNTCLYSVGKWMIICLVNYKYIQLLWFTNTLTMEFNLNTVAYRQTPEYITV